MRACSLILVAGICAAQPAPEVWKTYHDYGSMVATLRGLQRAHPELVAVRSIGRSVQGRDLWVATIASRKHENHKPEVLFDGGIHGSEVVGSEAVLDYARFLVEHYASDETARRLVDRAITHVIPMINPDGTESGKTTEVWKAARKNARGVNLNRNFDFRFDETRKAKSDDEDYPGPAAFSEPEACALRNFILERPVLVYLNCHAGLNAEPHLILVRDSLDAARDASVAAGIKECAGFGHTEGALGGGAYNWAYWKGMERLRRGGLHPIALIVEIYSKREVRPAMPNWWERYNPGSEELPGYLERARKTMAYLTETAIGAMKN